MTPTGLMPHHVVKSVMWQMLNGLSYLHQNWIIHRDLKVGAVGDRGGISNLLLSMPPASRSAYDCLSLSLKLKPPISLLPPPISAIQRARHGRGRRLRAWQGQDCRFRPGANLPFTASAAQRQRSGRDHLVGRGASLTPDPWLCVRPCACQLRQSISLPLPTLQVPGIGAPPGRSALHARGGCLGGGVHLRRAVHAAASVQGPGEEDAGQRVPVGPDGEASETVSADGGGTANRPRPIIDKTSFFSPLSHAKDLQRAGHAQPSLLARAGAPAPLARELRQREAAARQLPRHQPPRSGHQ